MASGTGVGELLRLPIRRFWQVYNAIGEVLEVRNKKKSGEN